MKIPKNLLPYYGPDPRIDDPWLDVCYHLSTSCTRAYYRKPTDADIAVFNRQMVLNSRTAPFLYSRFTPTAPVRWEKGSRPRLEKITHDLVDVSPALSDREKILRLLAFCRDIPRAPRRARSRFAGGTEEDVIDQSAVICNERNRVFLTLCNIAGFPGRFVGHFAGFNRLLQFNTGHAAAEVFLENTWAYLDGYFGKHFVWPDNSLASAWDLLTNPALHAHQPVAVRALADPQYPWTPVFKYGNYEHLTVIAQHNPVLAAQWTYTRVPFDRRYRQSKKDMKTIIAQALTRLKSL